MLEKWKFAIFLATLNLICLAPLNAAPITFEFTTDNFTDACSDPNFDTDPNDTICVSNDDNSVVSTITGTFVGEDKNNDGFISSFLFAPPSEMGASGFSSGANEVSSASFTLTGSFIEGVPGFLDDPVTSHTVTHDLTDITDLAFGFPIDTFFLLNYDLNGGGILGDGEFEGMFMGTTTIFYALGQFLPSPFVVNTVTENLLLTNNSTPCINGSSCGVLHSLMPDLSVPSVQRTSNFASVSQVSTPTTPWLFAIGFGILGLLLRQR